jgi:hypothetical protein
VSGAEPDLTLRLDDYDYVDFGCSSGGSMQFARERLGGGKGVGLDIDPKKVAASRAAGFDAHVADVAKLDPRTMGRTRFAVMAHFLEHLPNVELAAKCIESAVRVADEFVFIRQPYFDADEYLAALGLKLYWSHWRGHKNHMKARDFHAILDAMLERRRFRRYMLFYRTKIINSDDPAVHPETSPIDQHGWDASKHGPKPYYKFQYPVYREIGVLIQTQAKKVSEPPRRFLLGCDVVYDSQNSSSQ